VIRRAPGREKAAPGGGRPSPRPRPRGLSGPPRGEPEDFEDAPAPILASPGTVH